MSAEVSGNTIHNIGAALLMVTATLRTDLAAPLEATRYKTGNARRSETSVGKAATSEAKEVIAAASVIAEA